MKIVGLAANGKQAVEMFSAHRPDVMLLDWDMPVLDGIEPATFWPALGSKAVALNELDGFLAELERRLPWNRSGGG